MIRIIHPDDGRWVPGAVRQLVSISCPECDKGVTFKKDHLYGINRFVFDCYCGNRIMVTKDHEQYRSKLYKDGEEG